MLKPSQLGSIVLAFKVASSLLFKALNLSWLLIVKAKTNTCTWSCAFNEIQHFFENLFQQSKHFKKKF
jgi:hypothetical protein